MDVDISEEEQQVLISAVQSARSIITLATPTQSFGIPQESAVDYSVSGQIVSGFFSCHPDCLPPVGNAVHCSGH